MKYTVNVSEYYSVNYPTLECGFSVEIDSLKEVVYVMQELRREYAFVDKPRVSNGEIEIKVYENIEA